MGKQLCPPQHLGVVAIEKGAFESRSNTVAYFTYFYIIHIYKIPFLDILIDTSNTDRFITSTYKNPYNINSCTLKFHSECLFRYKRTIIKAAVPRAKLLPFSQTIFRNEPKNINKHLLIMGFPSTLLIQKLNISFIKLNNIT